MIICYGVIPYTTSLIQKIQYLCVKQHNSASWGFPKGHVQGDEDILQTALRELHEEVGISAQIRPNFSYSYSYTLSVPQSTEKKHKTVTLLLGQANSTVFSLQREEIEDAAWLTFEQATKRVQFASIQEGLHQAHAVLTKTR